MGREEWVRRLRRPIIFLASGAALVGISLWLGVLAAWTSGWFAAFLWAGLRFSQASTWKWTDPVYYPLAAIGVALLFYSTDRDREINTALSRQAAATDAVRMTERLAPLLDDLGPFFATLETGYTDLSRIAREGSDCRSLFIAEGGCAAKADQSDVVERLRALGRPPATSEDPQARGVYATKYCAALRGIPTLPDASGLDAQIMERLETSMRRMDGWRGQPLDIGNLARLKLAMREFGEEQSASPFLKGNEPNLIFARSYLDQATEFSVIALDAYSACLSLPQQLSENLSLHRSWKAKLDEQRASLSRATAVVHRLREPPVDTPFSVFLGWLRLNLWPYFLVAALACKFGKGIAGLRGKPTENSS